MRQLTCWEKCTSIFVSAFLSQLLQLYCLQLTRWLDIESFQNLSTTCGSCRFFDYNQLRSVSIIEVLLAEQRILLVVKETASDKELASSTCQCFQLAGGSLTFGDNGTSTCVVTSMRKLLFMGYLLGI